MTFHVPRFIYIKQIPFYLDDEGAAWPTLAWPREESERIPEHEVIEATKTVVCYVNVEDISMVCDEVHVYGFNEVVVRKVINTNGSFIYTFDTYEEIFDRLKQLAG